VVAWLTRRWYQSRPPACWLRPLATLYGALAARRRAAYARGTRPVWRAPVPLLVVGNISVGGTGKTPVTEALCDWLRAEGWRPGIISRGYGGKAEHYPLAVDATTPAALCGDEPLLLALSSGCPVVVDPDRVRAARHLLDHFDCDLIISDDGLQHYALGRDIEIAVVDGERGLGNGALLPAGPLREPPQRLATVDLVVINGGRWDYPGGHRMGLQPGGLRNLAGEPATLAPGSVHAVAGIGNPERFFATLAAEGFDPRPHPLPDHHPLCESDLEFADPLPVIMTAKDAVKCRAFAPYNRYYLPVSAQLPAAFFAALKRLLPPPQQKG
jgi:tetraacyldisaccharide 4'-kinase